MYEKSSHDLMPATPVNSDHNNVNGDSVNEDSEVRSWESFCQSKLSPLSAQAVLRVTSIAREGLVS